MHCSWLTHYFAKTSGRTNIFAIQRFHNILLWNKYFSRKHAKLSCHHKMFTKMIPLFYMLLINIAFFTINWGESQHLLIFVYFRKHFSWKWFSGPTCLLLFTLSNWIRLIRQSRLPPTFLQIFLTLVFLLRPSSFILSYLQYLSHNLHFLSTVTEKWKG